MPSSQTLPNLMSPKPETINPPVENFETQIPEQETQPSAEIPETEKSLPLKEQSEPESIPETAPQSIPEQFASAIKTPQIPQIKDELSQRIETIMEEDLRETYSELDPVQKQKFKIKGEETVKKIKELLKKTKTSFQKIVKLLLEWLKILPVDRYYLEQEAKIKADKIMALKTI